MAGSAADQNRRFIRPIVQCPPDRLTWHQLTENIASPGDLDCSSDRRTRQEEGDLADPRWRRRQLIQCCGVLERALTITSPTQSYLGVQATRQWLQNMEKMQGRCSSYWSFHSLGNGKGCVKMLVGLRVGEPCDICYAHQWSIGPARWQAHGGN